MCSEAAPQPVEGTGIAPALNVLGTTLKCCCADVRGTGTGTGFFRDGHCSTGPMDEGSHTVCVKVTSKFLEFSRAMGNDLSTPYPQYAFPGLVDGDIWCLCAQRWVQAHEMGFAPKLYLQATHENTLQHTSLELLQTYAIDLEEGLAARKELDEKRAGLEGLL